ncbi:conserved protein, unknown function [Hepatocystis sp. ex Piliocolobus tephrosceles]|nr:conserved protein, unknown function [Hepatocystis sp. ex Piliocolobus tephrosceles]
MDNTFIRDSDNFQSKKKQYQDIYLPEKITIDVNDGSFHKGYQNYLKNMNKLLILSYHDAFETCNKRNLDKILCNYGLNDLTKEFNKKLDCAHNFKFELIENYQMTGEDKYMENILKIENHVKYNKLENRYYKESLEDLNQKIQREYKNYERIQLEKEYTKKKKKVENILKNIISAAFKITKVRRLDYGENYFYDNLFYLERLFFIKKIKNINEFVQNSIFINKTNNAINNYHNFKKRETCSIRLNQNCLYQFSMNYEFLKNYKKIDGYFLFNFGNFHGMTD